MSNSSLAKVPISAEEVAKKVFDYIPPKFELPTPGQAHGYLETKSRGQDFRMSEVIRIQTGVKDIEAGNFDELVEQKTLDKLKDVQESAYQEAYQLGLEEGRHEAYKKLTSEIQSRLTQFDQLIQTCGRLKTDLFQFNETHLVKLAMHMASRLAHIEILANPEVIKDIMKSAIEIAQNEEEVVIQVSPSQFEFCETLKRETGREFEFLKKVRFEPVEEISVGGCVIETNYGEIDARFEERVSRLWESMSDNLIRVKDKISGQP